MTAHIADFAGIDLWIFDLDNTLYPRVPDIWDAVDIRMTRYIEAHLGLPFDDARALQKRYLWEYGLTGIGLMKEHGLDPAAFMDYAHDIDVSALPVCDRLPEAVRALPGRKIIHTNNTARHAARILDHLGFSGAFDAVYDIAATGYVAKPAREAFDAVLKVEGGRPQRAAMFEDSARNLAAPHAMGMRTVLIPTDCDWASHGADDGHVHHRTPDLAAFLAPLGDAR